MTRVASGNFKPNDEYEKMQFYYPPDHLGSSSYITNLDGEVTQHIEYVPFGEVFIEELEPWRKSATEGKANSNNTWNTPYLFNAKELDEETGLYYYGARYYDPRVSLWMSTDPLQEKYYDRSSYAYCNNNPIRFIDPDGKDGWDVFWGYTIGIVTNILPGTSKLRDLYIPQNRQDYNKALRNSDNISFGAGVTAIGAGATGTGAGTAVIATGGTVAATGIGVGPGAAGATVGAVVVTGSEVLVVGGTLVTMNAANNKNQGYDRGKKGNVSSGNKNSPHANQKKKEANGNRYEEYKREYDKLKSSPNKPPEVKKQMEKLKRQMNRANERRNFSGENHSRNHKGNR